jgi:hypothetical protein
MTRLASIWVVAIGIEWPAQASTYWIEYSAPDGLYPEEVGWRRSVFGGGAQRSFQDGALVLDGMASTDIADDYWMPTPFELGPQECLLVQWGLRVTMGAGFADPLVAVDAAEHGLVILHYQQDRIYSVVEYVFIPFEGGTYHEYTLMSLDLQTYSLYVDQQLAHVGVFDAQSPDWGVTWGDGTIGASSLSEWRYVRYGIVTVPLAGDTNCDGTVDFQDINPFVQALTDGDAYQNAHPACWPENSDINGDGTVDFGDINPFVELLLA